MIGLLTKLLQPRKIGDVRHLPLPEGKVRKGGHNVTTSVIDRPPPPGAIISRKPCQGLD